MSQTDSSSGQPDRGKREDQIPAGSPKHSPQPHTRLEDEDQTGGAGSVTAPPGIRILAWLAALVILLMILGWALGGGR